jgi:hypothetical protein
MREAFEIADPNLSDEGFLTQFQARGCYLTDLSHEPVDQLENAARKEARAQGEQHLSLEIARWKPEMVAPLLRSIVPNVKRATERAKWQGTMVELPYPGRWVRHRDVFLKEIVPILKL